MNYEKLYVNLLTKHGTEVKPESGYYERHHVLPTSLGGDDSQSNLVYLSGRVHFIAHWLLYKWIGGTEMATAFYGMCDTNRRPERFRPTSRKYAFARAAFALNNHMKQDGHRKRASESAKDQWRDDTSRAKLLDGLMPMFNNKEHPMYMKGKVGDSHPRSKAVVTPLGRFGSVRLAGKAHNTAHNMISRYCKSSDPKYSGFFYETELE